MPGHRKTFPCGHAGKGQYCHRCPQESAAKEAASSQIAEKRAEKDAWTKRFDEDAIDLRGLPTRQLVQKAREIIEDIVKTRNYMTHKGKRLNHDRTVISVPLTREYRIVFLDRDGVLVPKAAMTHEEYNGTKPGS